MKQNELDECDNDAEEDPGEGDQKLPHDTAPEYKRLIAIPAGKPKGGLEECLKVDPDNVRRLSLSEQQLEDAAETHGKEIVRYKQTRKHSDERTLICSSTCAFICFLKPFCHRYYCAFNGSMLRVENVFTGGVGRIWMT